MNRYLAAQGDRVPVHSVEEILRSRRFHPSVQLRLQQAQDGTENGPDTPAARRRRPTASQVREAVLKTMDGGEAGCVRLSDVEQPAAAHRRSEHAARRQQPVLLADDRLPRHHRADGLHAWACCPAGITFFGRAWDEPTLIAPRLRVRAGHASPPAAGWRRS